VKEVEEESVVGGEGKVKRREREKREMNEVCVELFIDMDGGVVVCLCVCV